MGLPLEVIELVIDQVSQDTAALKACSLTCRSWIRRSRHHLFASIVIPDVTIALKRYKSSEVSQYVSDLKIIILDAKLDVGSSKDRTLLWSLLSLFPQLQTLCISSWEGITLQVSPIPGTTLSTVESLTLISTKFDQHADFLSFLRSFPNISSLHLNSISWNTRSSILEAEPRLAGFQIRSMRLNLSNTRLHVARTLLAWVADLSRAHELQGLSAKDSGDPPPEFSLTLCISLNDEAVLSELAGFFHMISPTTQLHLHLKCSGPAPHLPNLGLDHRKNLRSLFFLVDVGKDLCWVSELLNQIQASNLRSVSLELKRSPLSHWRPMNPCPIADVLSLAKFDGLMDVLIDSSSVLHYGSESREMWKGVVEHIKKCLPNMHSRGYLRFIPHCA